jgi:hypothetical protein
MEDIKDETDIEKREKERQREEREEKKKYPYRNPTNFASFKYKVMTLISFATFVFTLTSFGLYFDAVSVKTPNT